MNEQTPFLLDTCAAIWISTDQPIAPNAVDQIERGRNAGQAIYVSPITAWEVGLLVERRRMNLQMSPERWFVRLMDAPGVHLADMPPSVLIAASFLPGALHRDPADRILAATAREYGFRLITRDRPLLAYAEQGHIQALAC